MDREVCDRLIDGAGFIRFSGEEDPDMPIDWASDYTVEIDRLIGLVVQECINLLATRKDHAVIVNSIKEVKEHFGVE